MDTTIKLTAGLWLGNHVYRMEITQPNKFNQDGVTSHKFEGGSFGWLSMQVAKDGLEDSLENVTIIDETVDPR